MGRQGSHSKWKMTKGESFKHKLTKPSTFRKFNKIEKGCLLGIIVLSGFFVVTYGYYINQVYVSPVSGPAPRGDCPTGYFTTPSGCQPDPYTTLWNGQASGKFGRDFPVFSDVGFCNATPCTNTMNVPSLNSLLMVTIYDSSTCSATISVTDTFLLSWTQFVQRGSGSGSICASVFIANDPSNTGSDTVSVSDSAFSASNQGDFTDYAFSQSDSSQLSTVRGFSCNLTGCGTPTSGKYVYTVNSVPPWGILVDILGLSDTGLSRSCASMATFTNSSGTNTNAGSTCLSNTVNTAGLASFHAQVITNGPKTNSLYVNDTWSGLGGPQGSFQLGLQLNGYPVCPATYNCGDGAFAYYQSTGNLGSAVQLAPSNTQFAVAETTSAIDLSNCSAKACAFSTDTDQGGTFGPAAGEQYAWFLRTNATLPEYTTNYNPLNDSSVVMVVYEYVTSSNTANYYVYLQRQVGQVLWQGSVNPGTTNCNFGGTLFSCVGVGIPTNHNSNVGDPVLNFTGGANNVNVNAGESYLCAGSINFGTHTCFIGGFASTSISFQAQVINQTLFPWLSIQNSYYFGFWEAPTPLVGCGGGGLQCPINEIVGVGAFAPIISVYTPPTVTISPNQDSGGFFGWVGRSLGGAYNAVSNFVSPAIGFLSSAGNSLLNAFISGFVQGVSILLQAYRLTLNFIGGLFGMGNLGDILVNTLVAIGALIVNGFSAIVSFFTGLGSIINSGYFTFLANAAILIATLLPLAILLWNIIFNAAFTVNDLLFIDYSIGMIMVAYATRKGRGALKAFFAWIALNKFLFTIVFNAAWIVFDIVTRPIHRTKETVDPVG